MRKRYRNGDEITFIHTGCDGCSPSVINGVLCHERECGFAWKDNQRICSECGRVFYYPNSRRTMCEKCLEEERAYEEFKYRYGECTDWTFCDEYDEDEYDEGIMEDIL